MSRLAAGERAAFEPLFLALQGRALRLAQARLGAAAAADVTQTALLKVFSRAHEFTSGRSALAWFYAIVANEVRSAQRAQRGHDALEDHALVAPGTSAEQLLVERELARALEAAIDELSPDESEAIRVLLGRSARPELESTTLRKRVSRAYAQLRILLGDLR